VHVIDSAEIIDESLQERPVRVDRNKYPLTIDILKKFNDPREKKGFAAAHQDKSDLVMRRFINHPIPDISLFAPLAAHSATKIAGVCDGERHELWKVHGCLLSVSFRFDPDGQKILPQNIPVDRDAVFLLQVVLRGLGDLFSVVFCEIIRDCLFHIVVG
jgi:hypothetical protein